MLWLLFGKHWRAKPAPETDYGPGGTTLRSEFLSYGLIGALAIGLLIAAFTDFRRRQIDNWLNASIALAAPLFWWASGLSLWPGVGWQVGVALLTFVITAALFALRAMGGGDVKLLTALALWIRPDHFFYLVVIMAMLGGLLTLAFGAWHIARRQPGRVAIPYGIAISAAGILTLIDKSLPVLGGGTAG